jgi:hypothetical protein
MHRMNPMRLLRRLARFLLIWIEGPRQHVDRPPERRP